MACFALLIGTYGDYSGMSYLTYDNVNLEGPEVLPPMTGL